MKTFVIFVIGVVLLQTATAQEEIGEWKGRRRCDGEHEKINRCGSTCPRTCENLNDKPTMCTTQCVPGCFCKSPYIRNSDGDCVLPSQCRPTTGIEPQPAICRCDGANEVYKSCGSLCPKTCDNRDQMLKCAAGCQSGCFCAPGYLRNKWKKCVLIRNCD